MPKNGVGITVFNIASTQALCLCLQINKGFAAIYADGGICEISPATRSVTSDQQLCFTWYRMPRI
eukprot:6124161-Pleurochrysis_carterae.AAC.1